MEKLLQVQSELRAPKLQFNAFGKYSYRSAEDILEALKPLLVKHDCLLFLSDEIVEIGGRVYVKAVANLSSGEEKISVSAYAREEETKKGTDGSQITGAASSYARKYALNGLFLIDDNKDSDATNRHGKDEEKKDTLKENTKHYKAVVKYIREGGSINEVEKRFKVSNPIKKKIYDEIQVQ